MVLNRVPLSFDLIGTHPCYPEHFIKCFMHRKFSYNHLLFRTQGGFDQCFDPTKDSSGSNQYLPRFFRLNFGRIEGTSGSNQRVARILRVQPRVFRTQTSSCPDSSGSPSIAPRVLWVQTKGLPITSRRHQSDRQGWPPSETCIFHLIFCQIPPTLVHTKCTFGSKRS